ncbi:MAG: nucleotidyltransferase [Candidatus Thermoplasmatota archaeon]|nr:nucleotidyltransferase [Candidatus Thermoplasmatota archaeon]
MIGKKEHRRVLNKLAEKFDEHGLHLLLLGSSSVLYRYGSVRRTKDIDVHPFPIGDYEKFYDGLEKLADELEGSFNIEIDASSITFFPEIDNKTYTVELIDAGGSHFLTREVLKDMVDQADKIGKVYVPSDEHLVVAKADAYLDRNESDPNKEKFFDDLTDLREKMKEEDIKLDYDEIDRIIKLRPERKHNGLKGIITSQFSDLYG